MQKKNNNRLFQFDDRIVKNTQMPTPKYTYIYPINSQKPKEKTLKINEFD